MTRRLMVSTLTAAMSCGVLLAQSTPPPASNAGTSQAQTANAPRIAAGSVIPVQLTKTVDAKKAKTGDEVVAKVTQDMKTQTGEVLVPRDTKVIGHVTEAQARSKEEKESELAIAFDHAVMKNGEDVRLPMSIQAVIAPQNNADGAPGGNDVGAGATSGGSMPSSTASSGRGGMGGSQTTPPPPTRSESMPSSSGNTQSGRSAYPPINAQTQGVIGVSNVTLSPAPNGTQGPVMSSEKSNVKLESGTMLLLKVNQ
jgi:hypothetical protein